MWLALEEKGLSYDCIPIELYNKPPWYEELVPTTLVSWWCWRGARVQGHLLSMGARREAAAYGGVQWR